jgi:hypothetical protein
VNVTNVVKSKLKDSKGQITGVDVSISLCKACSKDGVTKAPSLSLSLKNPNKCANNVVCSAADSQVPALVWCGCASARAKHQKQIIPTKRVHV